MVHDGLRMRKRDDSPDGDLLMVRRDETDERHRSATGGRLLRGMLVLGVFLLAGVGIRLVGSAGANARNQGLGVPGGKAADEIGPGVRLHRGWRFAAPGQEARLVAQYGPHHLKWWHLTRPSSSAVCSTSSWRVLLTGPAALPVKFVPQKGSKGDNVAALVATIDAFPRPGLYYLTVTSSCPSWTWSERIEVVSTDTARVDNMTSWRTIPGPPWNRDAYWLSTLGIATASNVASSKPDYLWALPNISWSDLPPQLVAAADAVVFPQAVVQPPQGYGKFSDLGNYELLCFVGNRTMGEIRESFMALRPQIFKNQRPFKFHFYDIANLQQPDMYWTDDNRRRLRKCKHLLVNLEEFVKPLSQRDYEDQLVNFIGHLLRVMSDDTFPIRVLTWIESPTGTRQCHSPYLPWTNDHPCHDVLHKLFDSENPVFSSRVKLMDNTDLTLPLPTEAATGTRPFVLAVMALRIYVIVGEQVAAWRLAGQRGKVDGLYRNGKVEPNFAEIPYKEWGMSMIPPPAEPS